MRVLLDENLPVDLVAILHGHEVGIVLVRAHSNPMIHLDPLVPEILATLASLRPGELRRVGV